MSVDSRGRMEDYYTEQVKLANGSSLDIELGSRFASKENRNPFRGVTPNNVITNLTRLCSMYNFSLPDARLGIVYMDSTHSYMLRLSSRWGNVTFLASGFPACCGSALLHSFAYYVDKQDFEKEVVKLFHMLWTIFCSVHYLTQSQGMSTVTPLKHRFTAVVVSESYGVDDKYYTRETFSKDHEHLLETNPDRQRFPLFHKFCKKFSTLNGSVPFYNVNSGNICETVVVVPPSLEELIKRGDINKQ